MGRQSGVQLTMTGGERGGRGNPRVVDRYSRSIEQLELGDPLTWLEYNVVYIRKRLTEL